MRLSKLRKQIDSLTHIGKTSRKMRFEARKVILPKPEISDSACDLLPEPIIVCVAEGTCVTPLAKQRKNGQEK